MKQRRATRAELRHARERRRHRRRLARRPSALLRALTASALALPGLARPAIADGPPTEARSDYHYSKYSESALSSKKVAAGGERDRYDIDIHQFRFETGLSDRVGVGIDIAHEVMSGATPWYITPDANGNPVQVMTQATIDEARTDIRAAGDLYFEEGKATLRGGISSENDYLAFSGGVGGERQFNEKNTTLSAGVGVSIDRLSPEDTDRFPTRPDSEDKQSYEGYVALSQILGPATIAQTSFKYQHARGFLSDPYKQAFVAGTPEADARPDTRNQFSSLTRIRHHFRRAEASLHFNYMFYADDWDLYSNTFELAWYQTLFDRFLIVPTARYYSQSQADFYAPYYTVARSDGLRSSDYRLSPFGAYSYGVKTEVPLEVFGFTWVFNAAVERYETGADLALQSVSVENPGLVKYTLLTVGLSGRF